MKLEITTYFWKFQWLNDNGTDREHRFWIVKAIGPHEVYEDFLIAYPLDSSLHGLFFEYKKQCGKLEFFHTIRKIFNGHWPDNQQRIARVVDGFSYSYLPRGEFFEKLLKYKKFRQGHRACWPPVEERSCENCCTQTCRVEFGYCEYYRFSGGLK